MTAMMLFSKLVPILSSLEDKHIASSRYRDGFTDLTVLYRIGIEIDFAV